MSDAKLPQDTDNNTTPETTKELSEEQLNEVAGGLDGIKQLTSTTQTKSENANDDT
jgi:bacteriocin-like protein